MPIKPHLHIYERVSTRKDPKQLFRCVDPDCSHYTKKSFLAGKRASCFFCFNEFILTSEQLNNKKPKCNDCIEVEKLRRNSKGQIVNGNQKLSKVEDLEMLNEIFN